MRQCNATCLRARWRACNVWRLSRGGGIGLCVAVQRVEQCRAAFQRCASNVLYFYSPVPETPSVLCTSSVWSRLCHLLPGSRERQHSAVRVQWAFGFVHCDKWEHAPWMRRRRNWGDVRQARSRSGMLPARGDERVQSASRRLDADVFVQQTVRCCCWVVWHWLCHQRPKRHVRNFLHIVAFSASPRSDSVGH